MRPCVRVATGDKDLEIAALEARVSELAARVRELDVTGELAACVRDMEDTAPDGAWVPAADGALGTATNGSSAAAKTKTKSKAKGKK